MDLFFGTDYYPEHWPEERWEEDARLMEEMGIDVVRMAEFSWAKMEPAKDAFHFDWLKRALEILGKHHIKAVLGTPSAAPPAWIIRENPEILPVDSDGIRREFGGRHHDCQSNPVYRRHIKRFVTAMAEAFRDNDTVVGWQIDNELGNSHQDLCMCDSCTRRFQSWLEKKYGEIDELNQAWGTGFWSQDYDSFSQISAPKRTVTGENPSQMLDWRRFCSDLIVEFQGMQVKILREICPDQFITHNFMGFADKVNYFDLAKDLDFIAHDQYPGGFFASFPYQSAAQLAAPLDLMRAAKNRSFWIMEQQSGITGWQLMGRAPKPGQLSMWSAQSIAHGADAVVYFRWRSCTVGTEQYWHGILPHSGVPGKRYRELKQFIKEMKPVLREMQGALPKKEAAIVFSYDQDYAMHIQPHHPELSYVGQVKKYYNAFHERNIPVDFVSERDDLTGYKLVIAPLQYIMTRALEDKYIDYVKGGGRLVLTMRTGVKDAFNRCMDDMALPGRLQEMTGIEILDYDCLRDTEIRVQWGETCYIGEKWADEITLKTAKALAVYASEYPAGTPAITENAWGDGKSYYVGTEPDPALMDKLAALLCRDAGLWSLGETQPGLELAHRTGRTGTYLFATNHTPEQKPVPVGENWKLVLGSEAHRVPAFGYNVYRLE